MKKGEILTHPRNKYSAAEMEYALLELALMNDNLARTARKVGIDSGTLGKWRNKYAERYEDIKARVAPMVEKQIVAHFSGIQNDSDLRQGLKAAAGAQSRRRSKNCRCRP